MTSRRMTLVMRTQVLVAHMACRASLAPEPSSILPRTELQSMLVPIRSSLNSGTSSGKLPACHTTATASFALIPALIWLALLAVGSTMAIVLTLTSVRAKQTGPSAVLFAENEPGLQCHQIQTPKQTRGFWCWPRTSRTTTKQ